MTVSVSKANAGVVLQRETDAVQVAKANAGVVLERDQKLHVSKANVGVVLRADLTTVSVSKAYVGVVLTSEAPSFDIKVGNVIGMQNDTWGGTPTSFTYRWFRHADAADLTGVAIAGATSETYPVAPEDEGLYLSGEKTPINASGTGVPVRSNIVGAILPADASTLPLLIEAGEVYEIGALSISGTPVLTATEGTAYTGFTVTAADGPEPWVFSLVGTWPAGITIDSVSGAVSGTPTVSGTFAGLSVRVTDAAGQTADLATFSIEVAAAFSALTLTGLNRWYDPSDAASRTIDGSNNYTALADKSGNGYGLSGSVPATGLIGGLTCLKSNGTTTLQGTTGVATPFSGIAKPFTFIAVAKIDTLTTNGTLASFNSASSALPYIAIGNSASPFPWRVQHRDDAVATTESVATTNADTANHVIEYVFDGSTLTIVVDGVTVLNADPHAPAGTLTLDRFSLFSVRNGVNTNFGNPAQLGEMILCAAALDATERGNARTYLAAKWGITI